MKRLHKAGVDSPRRDSLVLIEDLLDKDRSWVNAHAEFELTKDQIKKLDTQLKRRVGREPLAYIRGKAWFYGRFFEVNPDVMIPRPESESFIEFLKEIKPGKLIDIGTGSGCLAITAKLELPQTEVIAIDNSQNALKIAQKNAKNHTVNINFYKSNMFDPKDMFESSGDRTKNETLVVVANLPYVPENLITGPEIEHEPASALFSGKDGFDHYREFFGQVGRLEQKPKFILTESLKDQHKTMAGLAENTGYRLIKTDLLVQLFSRA